MTLSTFITAAAVLALIAGVYWLVRSGRGYTVARQQRLDQAIPAKARVVQVGRSLQQEGRNTVILRLRLAVSTSDRPTYQVTTNWEVETGSIPKVQEGKEVPVKIDAQDTRIIYPRMGWARYSWLYARDDTAKKAAKKK